MTGALLLLNAAMVTSLFSGQPGAARPYQPAEAQGPARTTFRSAVEVVSVAAVVRDRKGRFVGNLGQGDFVVAEAGEPRRILDFRAQSDGPVKLALLFDISGSMRMGTKVADARQAARHLFSAMKPGDEAAVFSFDTRLQRVNGFTADLPALEASLDRVEPPYGQTSLYDAIAETANAVALAGAEDGRAQQRSAIVVLTDGVDTRSRLTAEQVSSIASGIDIPVYVVTVVSPVDDPRRDGANQPGPLSNLAKLTGGDFFTTSAPAHASVAARQIVEELRHQYLLAFEASTRPGWRPLEVRARDTDLRVRARAGYRVEGTIGSAESVVGDVEQTNADRLTVPLTRRTR